MKISWYKTVFYPWIGAFVIPGVLLFFGLQVYRNIYPSDGPLTVEGICGIAFFLVALTAIILSFYNYIHIELDNKSLKVYLMLSAEDRRNERIISKDLKEHMYEQFRKDGITAKIIVPNSCYRLHFNKRLNRYSQKGESYCETGDWRILQYFMKGHIFIFGEIRDRKSEGYDQYEISNHHLIVTCDNNASDEAIRHLENSLGAGAFHNLIDKRYEVEQFNNLSLLFVDFTEYLVGITHLMWGAYSQAYLLHSKLCKRTIPNRRLHIYKDLDLCIDEEISILVLSDIRNDHIEEAKEKLNKHIADFSDSITTATLMAQALVCSSQDQIQCKQNAKMALDLLENQRTTNREQIGQLLYNRAYLHLLLGQYSDASKRYRAANRYSNEYHLLSIIEYCDYVLRLDKKAFEHSTAEYVKGYALYKLHKYDEAKTVLKAVIEHNEINSFYYIEATKMLLTL